MQPTIETSYTVRHYEDHVTITRYYYEVDWEGEPYGDWTDYIKFYYYHDNDAMRKFAAFKRLIKEFHGGYHLVRFKKPQEDAMVMFWTLCDYLKARKVCQERHTKMLKRISKLKRKLSEKEFPF